MLIVRFRVGDATRLRRPRGQHGDRAARLLPGDRVEIRVEGVGSLKNPVVKL